eukprot:Hpha_TRINITY_DN16794_c6_g2::TRINITY_DN16794_c6_g2_i8::g.78975::m.78975
MLCGKSWGLRRQAVRGLYLGYIQAAVDYCLAVYGRGDTKELKEAHLAAAELITGAAVASRHALILQEAELLPFDARVDSATALLVERAKHLLPGTPLRSVLEEAHDLEWVKKAEQSIEAAGVSGLREEIVNAPLAPWKFDLPITFASEVHGEVSKSDPPEEKKAASLRTLEALPQADWFIYTDGSAVIGVTKGGAGVILIHGATKRSWTFSRAAGSLCSSYRAEVCALRCAVEELCRILRETDLGGGVIRICTDSRAAICRLERGAALQRDKAGQQVWELLATLCEEFPGASVHVQFVYSHCGVEGNEQADAAAAVGSKLPQANAEIDLRTALVALKRSARRAVEQRVPKDLPKNHLWHAVNRRADDRAAWRVNRKALSRKSYSRLTCLRNGNADWLGYHQHKTQRKDKPMSAACKRCGAALDDSIHFLLKCPAVKVERKTALGPRPSLRILSQEPAKVARYIRLARGEKDVDDQEDADEVEPLPDGSHID